MSAPLYALQQDVDMLTNQVNNLKRSYNLLDYIAKVVHDSELEQLAQAAQMRRMEEWLGSVEKRMEKIEVRLVNVEKRVENIEGRLGDIEKRLSNLEENVNQMQQRMIVLENRMDRVEEGISSLKNDFREMKKILFLITKHLGIQT